MTVEIEHRGREVGPPAQRISEARSPIAAESNLRVIGSRNIAAGYWLPVVDAAASAPSDQRSDPGVVSRSPVSSSVLRPESTIGQPP